MLLIIDTELSFPELEDYLLSLGIQFNPQPTATMLNEKTGNKLVWVKRFLWNDPSIPLRLEHLPFRITKRQPHSCYVRI